MFRILFLLAFRVSRLLSARWQGLGPLLRAAMAKGAARRRPRRGRSGEISRSSTSSSGSRASHRRRRSAKSRKGRERRRGRSLPPRTRGRSSSSASPPSPRGHRGRAQAVLPPPAALTIKRERGTDAANIGRHRKAARAEKALEASTALGSTEGATPTQLLAASMRANSQERSREFSALAEAVRAMQPKAEAPPEGRSLGERQWRALDTSSKALLRAEGRRRRRKMRRQRGRVAEAGGSTSSASSRSRSRSSETSSPPLAVRRKKRGRRGKLPPAPERSQAAAGR